MRPAPRPPRLLAGNLPAVGKLLGELSLPPEAGELAALADLCRRSLRVRAWLFGRFAAEPATQAAFRRYLADPAAPEPWGHGSRRIAPAAQADPPPGTGPYGGLPETEILALIKGYQAGALDVAAFVLVRLWRRFLGAGQREAPFALQAATMRYWAELACDRSGAIARDLAEVLRFFRTRADRPIGEADFGHSCSWKIHLLVYLLDHPKRCYKTGELHTSLPAQHRQINRREVRDFCALHGIRRDPTPGQAAGAISRPKRSGRRPRPPQP